MHFELNAPQPEPLVAFYRDLFGWHLTEIPDGYWLVDTHAGSGINGGISRDHEGRAYSTFYVESPEPETLLKKAERAGGTVVRPITETPFATFGTFADPDGLIVGIVKALQGGRAAGPSAGADPPVDWFEITGTDPARTQEFYTKLFGWDIDRSGDTTYALVQHEHDDEGRDVQIAGGLGGGGTPWVTVYAHVPDVEASLQHAESLGGTRAYGPMDVGGFLTTGAFRDPAGNPFGLYHRI